MVGILERITKPYTLLSTIMMTLTAIFLISELTYFFPRSKIENFNNGVKAGRQQVLDSLAKKDSAAKKTSPILLPVPSQLRNQASKAKLPVDTNKAVRKQ
ncbi:MAG: hypothetical protein NTX79_04155 [Candidatus Micrarchaeota archaeon]|nr:hypothetical protein [Candidatus Micrarchaeota archaeon]